MLKLSHTWALISRTPPGVGWHPPWTNPTPTPTGRYRPTGARYTNTSNNNNQDTYKWAYKRAGVYPPSHHFVL